MDSLLTNQGEADAKVALHFKHAVERNTCKQNIVRSPAGDITILVMLLSTMTRQSELFVHFGTRMHRKGFTIIYIEIEACTKMLHLFS